MIQAKCEFCGKSFLARPNAVKRGYGKYCSRSCSYSKRVTKVQAKCEFCGKSFLARPNDVKRGYGKYCSRSCAGKVGRLKRGVIPQSGEQNPNWKGGISFDSYHYRKIQKSRYPDRTKARMAVYNAIRSGKIVRMPCEVCGVFPADAHHDDYSKPLDVRWLCEKHHREAHDGMRWYRVTE